MKILEAQSATLTNYEVYLHLTQQAERYERRESSEKSRKGGKHGRKDHKDPKDRRPGNLATIVKELLDYLREAPSPLGSQPLPYNERTIKNLLAGLRPWDFTKGEIIMILNLRPTKPENLNTIIEEMEERFPSDTTQAEILKAITDVLGRPDGEAERQAMTDNAREARKEQLDQQAKQDEEMEVDE
ncbi:DNA-directed RNA polymeras-like protein III subunit RPC9 [Venustampulla echinocandica]|uniref:DNA-directed RNA polymerase III subunit RPC9 n=1 Tax=Venustampulla echinocandica TaxID=2656787 RepID=A0A370U0G0_9HELO|nr:DNA-directed RNA polymeras-like protein III subunit RPC9 [Venustampulla echinocandica]RDL41258.1 DNA-directed RNA polymeras-like protein III subunit RPC9 [Venustampulla echinocandica]